MDAATSVGQRIPLYSRLTSTNAGTATAHQAVQDGAVGKVLIDVTA